MSARAVTGADEPGSAPDEIVEASWGPHTERAQPELPYSRPPAGWS